MLSESQERMLLVAEKGREAEIERVFEKWDLHAEAIGVVTEGGRLRVFHDGKLEADVPTPALTDEAPLYDRPWVAPRNPAAEEDVSGVAAPADLGDALLRILAAPNVASKRWIYRQYDSTVRTNTLVGPGSDAAVVRIKGTGRALAMSADGNGRYCWLDPLEGAKLAVAEACRNVAASGAVPIGATNCLNFGNPEKPEVMGQIVHAIRGIGEACSALGAPITGGNVSLYNETDGKPIFPTPILAVVGLLDDATRALRRSFVAEGDLVYLLGETADDIGGSEYLRTIHGRIAGRPPKLDLDAERRLHAMLAEGAARGVLLSAHDCSDGGLGVTLAECCFAGEEPGPGARVELAGALPADRLLFSETPSRAVVTTRDELRIAELARRHGVRWARIGTVGGDRLVIGSGGKTLVDQPVGALHEAWMRLESDLSHNS
jgi:phosphoribosylformylglycinamidine synthase